MMWFTGRQVMWLVCPAALLLPCELTSCSGIRRGGNRVCSSGNQQLMMRSTHWGSALLYRLDVLFPLRSPFVLRLWLHSACFRKQLYPIDPLLRCNKAAYKTQTCHHVVFNHEYSRTVHIFVHILRSCTLWCVLRPIYLSQPVALTHLCHTLLSHSVAREMRRCGGRWEFNKLW